MIDPKTLKERAQDTLNEWKSTAESLHLQLQLGKAEAEKEFEIQRQKLNDWAVETSKRVEEAKEIGEENTLRLKTSLEELRLQAALGKAETEDMLRDRQKGLKQAIDRLQSDLEEVFKTTREQGDGLMEETMLRVQDYQTRFEIFRLQLHLASAEGEQEWEKRRKEAESRLQQMKADLEKRAEEAADRWDTFSSEMQAAWKHVRKAFD